MSLETQAPPTTNHDFNGGLINEVAATPSDAAANSLHEGAVSGVGGGGGGGGTVGESTINSNRAEKTPRTPLKMTSENNADAMNTMMGAPPRASVATTIGLNGTQNQSQTNALNNNNHNLKSTESDDEDYSGLGGSGVGGHSAAYGGYWGALRGSSVQLVQP